MANYHKPLPKVNEDTQGFWTGCKAHELRFQKCSECGHIRWPPAVLCPECYSRNTSWIVSSGRGRIYSYVTYHVVFHAGFKDDVPYVVADVELEEGPRIVTNIVGCNPDEVSIDMHVDLTWDDITDDFSLPKFKPIL